MSEDKFPYNIPEEFWRIVTLIREDRSKYITALTRLSKGELIGFIWILQVATARITGKPGAEFDPEGSINSDAMWVISHGKEKYLEMYGDERKVKQGNKNPGLYMLAQEVFRARFHQDVPLNEWRWDDDWKKKNKRGPWGP